MIGLKRIGMALIISTAISASTFGQVNTKAKDLLSTSVLIALPDVEAVEPSAPMKSPSLANDLDTTVSVPTIPRVEIYWGEVGEKGGYSLSSVMSIAWKANPNWATFSANHATAHAELIQACALPNPEIEMEYGSIKADETGDHRGIWSLGFSQPIQMPGKRAARQAEAMAGFAVADADTFVYANTLKADVTEAYWTIQYHTALEKMYAAQVTLTQRQYELTQKRMQLGDAGKVELTNTRLELLKNKRERGVAQRRKLGAMAALNALAGGRLGSTVKLADNFPKSTARPSLPHGIQTALNAHPKLGKLAAELEQRYASITRQNREWWPDVKLGARKSKEFEGDGLAVTAGFEIPLWNRNEGGIAKAEAEAQKTYAAIFVAYNDLRRDVETAYQSLLMSREQIASYDDGLKESAEELIDLVWQQFNLGGAGYIDILLARRQLIEIEQGYIQALYDGATAQAKYDLAVGR